MPFVTSTDDVKLHVVDEGSGPAVVFIGGFGMAATGWTLQRQALVDRYRVVSVDRRSHGDSEHVLRGQRMARHAKDVADVLAALDVDDAVLVGASMGASVIWAYLDLFSTAGVRGVVTMDQTPKIVNDDTWSFGIYDLTGDKVEAFVAEFPGAHNPVHRMPPAEVLALLRSEPPPYDDLRGVLRDHVWADWRDVVARMDVPALAIAGRNSPLWSAGHAEWIADAAPQGRAVVIDDCGHVPFLEQPEQTTAALEAFLSDVSG